MPTLAWNSTCHLLDAAIGPSLQFWAPDSCNIDTAVAMTVTSLPRLEHLEFPQVHDDDDDTDLISAAFMIKLVSSRPPLRIVNLNWSRLESESILTSLLSAWPTLQHLCLGECSPITDTTLAALSNDPPLHSLELLRQVELTSPAIASYLRARGSKLRRLDLHWSKEPDALVLAALASHAPNIESIQISQGGEDFTWGHTQFSEDLVRTCPRSSFIP
ncbi:hypothetical protein BDK51DRAFT_50581, partial [Blyttiomyces helicus]